MSLTNLDQPLFDGADATKRDLVDYLDGVSDRILPVLEDRPLSVIRVHRGEEAFMQKNVPKYTPDVDADGAVLGRDVQARRVLRAVQRPAHLAVVRQPAGRRVPPDAGAGRPPDHVTHLVLDLDPPEGSDFAMAVRVAHLVRQALADLGLDGAVKTSGAKGVHVFVPVDDEASPEDAAAATRAIAARAERLDPDDRHDRLHEGGPRRQGVRRLDTRRRGHRGRRLQPAGAPGVPGVVPRRLGRPRRA